MQKKMVWYSEPFVRTFYAQRFVFFYRFLGAHKSYSILNFSAQGEELHSSSMSHSAQAALVPLRLFWPPHFAKTFLKRLPF